ncbi:MAG: hypothetical protein ACF8CQ_22525 [Rhodopirellula sp. JB044]|uniref:hypothetical protein n=1 Tax=Rhodopirellula sp. JB044 TaxID=3342844 RepID=UPI00370CBC51
MTRNPIALAILVAATLVGIGARPAYAVEGSVIEGGVGLWAPLLPELTEVGGASDSGDSVGTLLELSGHHRFDGYLTSVEAGVEYGVTNSVEMFGYEFLLRDTWSFKIGELSAGTGFSQMEWDRDWGHRKITNDYTGAKIRGGWETTFGRQPIWIDLTLGIYDFDGTYDDGVNSETVSEVTTTWGLDVKADCDLFRIPMRFVGGIDYLNDMTTWDAGQIGTDDAVALSGSIEFRLW